MNTAIINIKKIIFLGSLLSVFVIAFLATNVSAASLFSGAKKEACAGAQLTDKSSANCSSDDTKLLGNTIEKGIDLISIVVGVISVVVIIIGGIRYIVSDGDSAKINTARSTIIYALVGLILVAFAQVIVKLVLTKVG